MPSPEAIKTSKPIYSFIAYAQTPESVRDPRPNAGDAPLTIRTQTFVRFAPAIKVKNIAQNSTGKSVAVTFDGSSVGYTKDLNAHLVNGDPGVELLQAALDENRPIAVGIEAHRKTTANHKPLSRVAPIHALRGADEKGRKANSNTTGTNIGANVIAYVDGHTTVECASNPDEWADLYESNTTGLVAPHGWRVVTSPDWGEYSFIAQDDTARSGAVGSLDSDAITALEKVVYDVLVRFNDESSNNIAHEHNGVPTEGRPWTVRTSDGRMSLGNYSQSRYADLLAWWTRTLRQNPAWSGRGVGPVQPLAQIYAHRTFDLLNRIVTEAYSEEGKAPWPADPAKEGWRTAWRHLTILLGDALAEAEAHTGDGPLDLMVFVTDTNDNGDLDEAAWDEWSQFWGVAATNSVRHASAVLDAFYSDEWQARRNAARKVSAKIKGDREKDQRARVQAAKAKAKADETPSAPTQQQSAPAPTSSQPGQSQQSSTPENPGDASIRASLYAAVEQFWDDGLKLSTVKDQMAAKDFLGIRVSAKLTDGRLDFLTDPQDGCKVNTLVSLLDWRLGKLAEAQQQAQAAPTAPTGQANAANGGTLGVDVPEGNRVEEIKALVEGATDPEDLQGLADLINAESLGDAEIMINGAPSSLGVYVRFRIKQSAKAS